MAHVSFNEGLQLGGSLIPNPSTSYGISLTLSRIHLRTAVRISFACRLFSCHYLIGRPTVPLDCFEKGQQGAAAGGALELPVRPLPPASAESSVVRASPTTPGQPTRAPPLATELRERHG